MTTGSVTRLLSTAFLSLAVALVAYGLFGLAHFAWYTGEYFDDRLVLFDNGVYPFMWGITLLVIGQLARLHHRRPATFLAAGAALALFVWKRATVPGPVAGQELFPDAELLNELIAIAFVLLALALADRPIQRVLNSIRTILRRTR
ncbi:hypothetical protein ACNRBH_09110 [Ralstonia pseudosolanacearum]|uniref:hypothetical protein n=1 Tax=Ralstonia pseudosolanacearum TaxID=1310165 RepID=UPI0026769715|nr:hypothetical protein [Ralstonia pseudosolanacearum]MDO3527520.1 hypothetical protein [Ralstonia pseudosolanacearum]MDO3531599.1 hypothetical protein [Ralstonia pseudosolanacearum]